MITKECISCKEEKEIIDFPTTDAHHKSGRRNICKICHSKAVKNRVDKMRNKRREIIQNEKNKPCHDCGIQYPHYVMDFDHIKGRKLFNISQAIGLGKSEKKLLAEIKKCDVVCSNCHRIRSYNAGHIRQSGNPCISMKMSTEWRTKLSVAQTGKKLTNETKAKMSSSHQKRLKKII